MIEPELAFATLEDNMECAESYLKFCLGYVLKNNREEIEFLDKDDQKKSTGLVDRLLKVIETPFKRVTYTEGVHILE
jgi:asparaginyl-tRNA synthetase